MGLVVATHLARLNASLDVEAVDPDGSGVHQVGDLHDQADVLGEQADAASVLGGVEDLDGLFHRAERDDHDVGSVHLVQVQRYAHSDVLDDDGTGGRRLGSELDRLAELLDLDRRGQRVKFASLGATFVKCKLLRLRNHELGC